MPGPALAMVGGSLVSAGVSASASKKAAKAQQASADQATALQRDIYDQTTANYAPYLDAGNDAMAAYLYEMGMGPKPTFGGVAPTIETFTENGPGAVPTLGGIALNLPASGTSSVTKYRVGGQTFSTLDEAQKWADANKTGASEYQGYQQSPMAKYLMEQGMEGIQGAAAASGGLYSGATLQALEDNRKQVIQADTADYISKLYGMANMGMSAAGNQASAGGAYANNVGSLQMQAGNAKAQGYIGAGNAMSGFINDAAGIAGYYGWGQNTPQAAYASPTMKPQPNPYY